jgi:hypothetical protein
MPVADLPRPKSSVMLREVPGGGAVLFSTSTELYYSLNRVGVEVWRLLGEGCGSEPELVEALRLSYPEVRPQQITDDVRSIIAQLSSNGLVDSNSPGV